VYSSDANQYCHFTFFYLLQKLRIEFLTVLRGHEAAIRCMSVCRPFGFVVTGGDDCSCIIWDTNRLVSVV